MPPTDQTLSETPFDVYTHVAAVHSAARHQSAAARQSGRMSRYRLARVVCSPGYESAALFKEHADSLVVATPTYSTSAVDDFLRHPSERLLVVLYACPSDLGECAVAAATGAGARVLVGSGDEAAAVAAALAAATASRGESVAVHVAIWADSMDVGVDGALVVSPTLRSAQSSIARSLSNAQPARKVIMLSNAQLALTVE